MLGRHQSGCRSSRVASWVACRLQVAGGRSRTKATILFVSRSRRGLVHERTRQSSTFPNRKEVAPLESCDWLQAVFWGLDPPGQLSSFSARSSRVSMYVSLSWLAGLYRTAG